MPEVHSPVIGDAGDALSFVIRVNGEPAGLMAAVRAAVADVPRGFTPQKRGKNGDAQSP